VSEPLLHKVRRGSLTWNDFATRTLLFSLRQALPKENIDTRALRGPDPDPNSAGLTNQDPEPKLRILNFGIRDPEYVRN
jgi:hypothetical protein